MKVCLELGPCFSCPPAIPPALPNLLALIPNVIAARAVYSLDGATRELVDVRRLSDNAMFTLSSGANGFIDDAPATTAAGASSLAILKVYDQSGNGNHATQGTALNQPYLLKNPVTGKWEIQFGDRNGRGLRYFHLPETVVNDDSFMLRIGRAHNNYDSDAFGTLDDAVNFGTGVSANRGIMGQGGQNLVESYYYFTGSGDQRDYPGNIWDCRLQCKTFNALGPNMRIRRWPDFVGIDTNAPWNGEGISYTVNLWGTLPVIGDNGCSAWSQALIVAPALRNWTTEDRIIAAYTAVFCGAAPTKSLYWFGDSTSDGYDGEGVLVRDADRGIPLRVQGALGDTFVVHCAARSGLTISQLETSAVAHWDTPAWREAGMTPYVVLFAGYNDAFTGDNSATILGHLQTFVTNRRAAGAAKVLVCTLPIGPGITGANLATLSAVNAGIPSLTSVDSVIDLASLSSSLTFQPDGIHPTVAAAGAMATFAAPVIAAI